jgi:hypothetical protein
MDAILRPSNGLTEVVCSCGKAVVSTGKIWETSHLVVLPNKAQIDKSNCVRPTVEGCTTPSLAERLWIGGLRDTHHDALGILDIPSNTAVWTA